MPLIETVYICTRFTAIVLLGIAALKGLNTPTVEMEDVPTEAGFGWEKNMWWGEETIRPDMPDPIQVQIERCEKISQKAPAMKTRLCCMIQKVKLQGLRHALRFMRTAHSFATSVLPALGGYAIIMELMAVGFLIFTIKSQSSTAKMLREKIQAAYKSVKTCLGQERIDPVIEIGKGQKYEVEELKAMDLENSHEADRLSTPGGEEPALPCSTGGRRFHDGLIFQERVSEEVSASSGMSGSEVDGKMKKEVRFCDDSFDGHLINDAYAGKTQSKVPQRRGSPVKRILSEPVSKMTSAKMTRSVPTAAGGGAGSKSSWHH